MLIQAIMVDFKYSNAVVIPGGRTGGSNKQTNKVIIGVKEQQWGNVTERERACPPEDFDRGQEWGIDPKVPMASKVTDNINPYEPSSEQSSKPKPNQNLDESPTCL